MERTHALEYLPMIHDLPMDLRHRRAHALPLALVRSAQPNCWPLSSTSATTAKMSFV